jgi:hypothetical protein
VYVDGIIITGSDDTAFSSVIKSIGMEFTVKDLGPLHYFLGVKAHFISRGLFLSRQRYVLNLLQHTNMMLAKSVSSPMSSSHKLSLSLTGTRLRTSHYIEAQLGLYTL